MNPAIKFILSIFILGGLGGMVMNRFMEAVRAGENFMAALCVIGWIGIFTLIWRVAQNWRKVRGWQ